MQPFSGDPGADTGTACRRQRDVDGASAQTHTPVRGPGHADSYPTDWCLQPETDDERHAAVDRRRDDDRGGSDALR